MSAPPIEEIARMAIEDFKDAVEQMTWMQARFAALGNAILRDANEHGYKGQAYDALRAIVDES
jgi:hypothetical protein